MASVRPFMAPCPGMAPRRSFLSSLLLLVVTACSGDPAAEPTTEQRVGLKTAGENCTAGTECDSGFCGDGVCCTTACNGTCVACAATLKQSLSASGTCGPALEGLDPQSSCDADAVGGCGKTGSCDGKGACALVPQGAACGTDAGAGNTCVIQSAKGAICSGGGACYVESSPAGIPCAPYACKNGSCAFPCAADADCQPPNRCESGVCKPKRQNGIACTDAGQCASGNCTDGVCCDANCSGQCQACNLAGKVGTCSFALGTPVAPRPDCSGSGACKGTCSGSGDKCSYPGNATSCASASCTGDVSTAASTCDGTGACAAGETTPCVPFACDTTSGVCKKACAGDADCSQGGTCDTSTGKCAVASATCADAHTVKLPNNQTQSCSPYKCVGGKCQQQCSTSGDCAPDYECQGKSCVEVGDAAAGGSGGSAGGAGANPSSGGKSGSSDGGADGGCGCSAPHSGKRGLAALLLLALGVVVRRRRGT